MPPIISIVIPCYNHGKYIREALESITSLTDVSPCEIVIVNDGSTDEYTIRTLHELTHEGYKVIHQSNQGLASARNTGIRATSGTYILPLDSDNKIDIRYITKATAILDGNQQISVVYSDALYFGEENHMQVIGSFDIVRLLARNYIDACAVFRKSLWEEVGGYDTRMPHQGWEDWDFWLAAIKNGHSFFWIPEPLFHYRVTSGSMLRSDRMAKEQTVRQYLYKKYRLLLQPYYNEVLIEMYQESEALSEKLQAASLRIESLKLKYRDLLNSREYLLGAMMLRPLLLFKKDRRSK